MPFVSVNPANDTRLGEIPFWDRPQWEASLGAAATGARAWRTTSLEQRAALLFKAAELFRARRDALAHVITAEMGKLIHEARAEVEKCALGCEYYAKHGAALLGDEIIASDAAASYVRHDPLGIVLAIMPWNFPFWQLVRCAAPLLIAGNVCVFKHASNVANCALAIERVFADAGFPEGVVSALMISAQQVHDVIRDARVRAVTLTGSEAAGRQVAATAGSSLKKCVMELGGSDAFIVLRDADLEHAVQAAVHARFQNAGQSCIAAKRFIVVADVAEEFVARFNAAIDSLRPGDPLDANTTLAPMARRDLRAQLDQQVRVSIARGAHAILGCAPIDGPGYFYAASLLDYVAPGMAAFDEELFGPVAAIVRARDDADAIRLANASRFGLGASLWTRDVEHARSLAARIDSGMVFINGLVKSDPRLPFGGIKDSGFGRELSHHGAHEFVNAKTVWIGPAR